MGDGVIVLMGRYCDGDGGAFRAIYATVAPRLLGYLVHMTHDRCTAEDLLQMTFLKAHRSRGVYVRGADPVPWFYAIAHRSFLDHVRRRRRARVLVTREGEVPDAEADITGAAQVVEDTRDDVDVALAQAALIALDALPSSLREAVILTKLDGRSFAEAADIAGTTPGAMKVRAHRGYVALRKVLATSAHS
jgi:RNA polymerase sigma-70 factor (ECF subfamily)